MSDDLEFTMTGEKEVLDGIARLGTGMMKQAQEAGLAVGTELVLVPARDRAPKKTGRLRRSGEVVVRKFQDTTIVKITFGSDFAPYALFVHENLEARHKNGEAKFLERAFLEARPRVAQAFADRISLAKAVRG